MPRLNAPPPPPARLRPPQGTIQFQDIRIVAERGREYHLNFVVDQYPWIQNVTSVAIAAYPCGQKQFYLAGDIDCRSCVTGAQCNGSDVLTTEHNYWRPNAQTLDFFEYAP